MNLLEHEGKNLLSQRKVAVPRGEVAVDPSQAAEIASRLDCELMVKAQVRTGRRGRQGGVMTASSPSETEEAAEALLKSKIGGLPVESVLVEERVWPERELYAGVTLDRGRRSVSVLLSARGGVDVENSGAVPQIRCDGVEPLWPHRFVGLGREAGLKGELLARVAETMLWLTRCFWDLDATTAEINPLAVMPDGGLMALDAKMVIDDFALFRQADLARIERGMYSEEERKARDSGADYVPLEGGEVGIIAGGAGLGMATMDVLCALGAEPAAFFDLGGAVTEDRMASALRIVSSAPGVKGIIINAFGGITNCEIMARGISDVVRGGGLRQPLVVKMRGHSQEKGWELLTDVGVSVVKLGTTGEAVAGLLKMMESAR